MSKALPGREKQFEMSPVKGEVGQYYEVPDYARMAAVLALLVPKDGVWQVIFIKRLSNPKDKHSGQISFPGGGLEAGDLSFEDCARRETYEEIGIKKEKIKVIGSLTKLYVYASNNLVYPYVGYLEENEQFNIQTNEVERVITSPVSYFSNNAIIKSTELYIRGYKLKDVPYYDLNGEILWGATAMMMSELIHLWKQVQ